MLPRTLKIGLGLGLAGLGLSLVYRLTGIEARHPAEAFVAAMMILVHAGFVLVAGSHLRAILAVPPVATRVHLAAAAGYLLALLVFV